MNVWNYLICVCICGLISSLGVHRFLSVEEQEIDSEPIVTQFVEHETTEDPEEYTWQETLGYPWLSDRLHDSIELRDDRYAEFQKEIRKVINPRSRPVFRSDLDDAYEFEWDLWRSKSRVLQWVDDIQEIRHLTCHKRMNVYHDMLLKSFDRNVDTHYKYLDLLDALIDLSRNLWKNRTEWYDESHHQPPSVAFLPTSLVKYLHYGVMDDLYEINCKVFLRPEFMNLRPPCIKYKEEDPRAEKRDRWRLINKWIKIYEIRHDVLKLVQSLAHGLTEDKSKMRITHYYQTLANTLSLREQECDAVVTSLKKLHEEALSRDSWFCSHGWYDSEECDQEVALSILREDYKQQQIDFIGLINTLLDTTCPNILH